ncbi:MAG: non-ribosomal peptide synthetase, partial [Spongiibacteraceae bacterium]|jgi:acyl-CoA synthetase (AMP-forming)/AMP-acid ligase II/acyl carrier protein|nr:non-ribosomal peptide synthetase [Spongiibacteraceae bacterium]
LYLPLLMGGSLVLASAEEAMDGAALARLLDAQRIDLMQATPSTWRLLLASGWTGSGRLRALVGGEALPADLARDLQPRVKALWNMYGPTETAVWSTCYEVTDPQAPLLIGAPIANTRCHVVDTRGLPVPPGVAGELWIGGDGVATGYLARPELTAAQFVAEPGAPGQRCYRTGDRARWRREGLLEYFQRMDQQVKVRGFRIELGEIEAVLARHPAVEEVAVLARTYGVTDQRLVAYVRFAAGQHLTNTELRRFLRDSLPDYMIPQLLVEMEAMPLTPNGKLDRKALPDPLGDTRRERQMTPPRSDAERALAEIWREVLKVADIGIDSYFFDIGGHSLLAMEVMLRVKQRFGVALHPRELILNTLEQLAAQITGVQEAVDAGDGGKPERGPGLLRRLLGRRN